MVALTLLHFYPSGNSTRCTRKCSALLLLLLLPSNSAARRFAMFFLPNAVFFSAAVSADKRLARTCFAWAI
ncbi:hypothetical protein L916_18210 [Phytophthora nicotianae]|uniref:Secreted protein n=2 Tax=Phytophthora nicotianae TaxID=4792 RepID=V9DYM4_PHYNI|nr:hypothetical protein F443_21161 [Phytophthora nicotianae P1569]ETL28450.1 hypothetical protein L916_18210 [Phytophthora nicotianae]